MLLQVKIIPDSSDKQNRTKTELESKPRIQYQCFQRIILFNCYNLIEHIRDIKYLDLIIQLIEIDYKSSWLIKAGNHFMNNIQKTVS